MEKKTLYFKADNQSLVGQNVPARLASDTVSYIEAVFDLGENWSGFDAVKAVWSTDFDSLCTVLDSSGACVVPHEVLERVGNVWVNLVGSISEDETLTDRLTTYPVKAITVDANAAVCGSETSPITPSQFDQFVEAVRSDADRAEDGATAAAASALAAAASATSASGSAADASQSASGASQSAQSASESAGFAAQSASDASESASDAEEAKDTILNMTATATTLPEGSQATVDYNDGVMAFGIPRGDKGAKGDKGETGETGATPQMSIGTVETLAPDEDATATITGTAENPILNLGIPQGEVGEVSYADLKTLLPMDTASGAIVSITDGQSVIPVDSLKVALEPIQDLRGYDKPWSGGAGKNKYNPTSYAAYLQSDGTYKLTGAQATAILVNIPASMVGVSCCFSVKFNLANSGTLNWMRTRAYINDSYINGSQIANGNVGTSLVNFTPVSTDDYIYVEYGSGGGNNIIMSELQLEAGSTATDYEPYSNICPISGHTEVVTEVCGANIWGGLKMAQDIADIVPNSILDTARKIIQYEASKVSGKVLYDGFLPNTQYTIILHGDNLSATVKTPNLIVAYTDGTSASIQNFANNSAVFVTDPEKSVSAIKGVWATSTTILDYEQCGVFEGNLTADQFEPYINTSYTTTLGRTVYGGTLDVVSGELVVDRAMVDLSTLTWSGSSGIKLSTDIANVVKAPSANNIPANIVAEKYATSAVAPISANDGKIGIEATGTRGRIQCGSSETPSGMLCYELATPQTYQLTPQAIALLTGDNNVWSPEGQIQVKYRANIGLYVDKKISEVNA